MQIDINFDFNSIAFVLKLKSVVSADISRLLEFRCFDMTFLIISQKYEKNNTHVLEETTALWRLQVNWCIKLIYKMHIENNVLHMYNNLHPVLHHYLCTFFYNSSHQYMAIYILYDTVAFLYS